ncbi:hypothetical protein KCU81_g205, partial [Aureobasidium melanogenum]
MNPEQQQLQPVPELSYPKESRHTKICHVRASNRTFSGITSQTGQPHYSGDMLALIPVSDSRLHRLSSVSLGFSTGAKDSTWVPAEGSGPVDHTEGLIHVHIPKFGMRERFPFSIGD